MITGTIQTIKALPTNREVIYPILARLIKNYNGTPFVGNKIVLFFNATYGICLVDSICENTIYKHVLQDDWLDLEKSDNWEILSSDEIVNISNIRI